MALAILLLSLVYSCKKATLNQPDVAIAGMSNGKSSDLLLTETNIGKKLENPYTVANMRKALANLATKGDVKKVENLITASHYYIKFMPKDDAQYALLKVDSNLVIYPFPLDVKLSRNKSGSYREPGLPDGVPTYQYAAVPVGYKLPRVGYEVLADLYLPNERMRISKVAENGLKSLGAPEVTVKSLVNEAERLVSATNGFDEELPPIDDGGYGGGGGGGGGSACGAPYGEWRPSGRMTMIDDVHGSIGVEGLKIRARRWFTTYEGITDANGNYCVDGTFTRQANYWMDFERYHFSVNDHSGGPREIGNEKRLGPWDFDFTGYDKFCATIFRAAYHYYYKDIQGLDRPPLNSFWVTQMKIGAYNSAGSSDALPIRGIMLGEFINIYTPNRSSEEIYATTIHELGHMVHWLFANNFQRPWVSNYDFYLPRFCESWARGVQWALTGMEYPGYEGGLVIMPDGYTNVVIDLIDENYDASNRGYNDSRDLVSGYTIKQIQDALHGAVDGTDWKNNLKNNYANSTEQNLDALFNAWGF